MWAKVMCHFRCEGCQRRSPLNHLDTDGEVSCLRCGERNDFDAGQWLDAIDHAEACARKGGGELRAHGEDRLVPHRIRQKTLVTRATGGHPTCRRCAAALTVVRCKVGMLVVACSACDREWKYVLPRGTRASRPQLGGVIAAAHRRGETTARVVEGEGSLAVECAQCGAAVSTPDSQVVVGCDYCGISLSIPANALPPDRDLEPEAWWLYFPG